MAFIRRKKVHGYTYHQAVRNYRDRDGKHRQEVLCHLGVHSSLEAAIDAERKKVKLYRERESSLWTLANDLRADLLDRHGWEFENGELPSKGEAAREFTSWWDQLMAYHAHNHSLIDIEEVIIQLEKYESCISYYIFMQRAGWAALRADAHQNKLDKYLRVKREYF